MANFLNYIIESSIQPVKTNVLWIKNGVPYYFNKKWKPLLGGGSGGGIDSPIIFGDAFNSAILKSSNNIALGENSIALGLNLTTNNIAEAAFGKFNKSIASTDPSKATLFTIGNGVLNTPKNAFEIRYDNSIYIDGIEDSVQEYLKHLKLNNEELTSSFNKTIEDINKSIIETNSKIEQTAEGILLEVNKTVTELDGKITENSTNINITAEAIRSEVSKIESDLNDSITKNTTLVTQTAEEIKSVASTIEEVDNKVIEQQTIITQTSEKIESVATKNQELDNKIVETASKIEQTSEQLTSEVSRLENKYDEEFVTTKNSISTIEQKANGIDLKVEEIITTSNELSEKVEQNTASINLTNENIEATVENITKIDERLVKAESSIEVNKNAISSRVDKEEFNAVTGEINEQYTEVIQTVEGITQNIQAQDGRLTQVEATVQGLTVKTGTLEADVESLKKQSDGAIDTYFGNYVPTLENEPAVSWITEEEKYNHTGDLYYNNISGEAFRFTYDPDTNTYFWVMLSDSALTEALDKLSKLEGAIDGKNTTYVKDITDSSEQYKLGDTWILPKNLNNYLKGTILTCIKDFNVVFDWNDWEELIRYTDDSALNEFKDSYTETIDVLKTQVDKKAETWYQDTDPSLKWNENEKALHIGDLWYNTSTQESFHWNGLVWEFQNIPIEVFDTIDSKSSIYVEKPESYQVNDIWVLEKEYTLNNTIYKKGTWVVATETSDVWNADHWVKKDSYTDDTTVNELNSYIDGAFSDNILEEREKSIIKEAKKTFDSKFDEIAAEYSQLLVASYVEEDNTERQALISAYNTLSSIKTELDESIKNILDSTSTSDLESLKNIYDAKYVEFVKALQNYRTAVEKLKEEVNKELNSANQYIANIVDDNVVTPIEKKQLFDIWRQISEEFSTNKGIAVNYKIIDSEGNQRTDIYESNDYYSIYKAYKDSYDNLIPLFNAFELDKLNVSTTLAEEYNLTVVNDALNEYYNTLKEYSKLISKITIEITDAHEEAIKIANSWQEHLKPTDEITHIGKGVILSTVIGVQSNGQLEAGINASDIEGLKDPDINGHGRIVFAGGIKGSEDWNVAKTVIYEDGYVKFRYGEIEEGVILGNAILSTVDADNIKVLSYPIEKNGKKELVPLFQINTDENNNILSISSVYDLYVNGNLVVKGDSSSEGTGENIPIGTTKILINDKEYNSSNGIIDLTDAFSGLQVEIDLSNYYTRNEVDTLINNKVEDVQSSLDNYLLRESTSGQTIKGDIRIEGNLVVTGDTASGGEAGGSSEIVSGDKHYEHVQSFASDEWEIEHNLNKYPSITVVDSAGTVVFGEVNYPSRNKVTIKFMAAFGGRAYLN